MLRRANKIENAKQRTDTIADIQEYRRQIRQQLQSLNSMDATVSVNTKVTGSTMGLTTAVTQGRRGQFKHEAAGGPVGAGQTYVVGERGPEMLVMGSQNGHIIPNHSLGGGGNIVVNVDGERLFQIMNRRMGRAMAMGV